MDLKITKELGGAGGHGTNPEGVESDVAMQLIEDAHQICPYSKLTREGMEVELNVVG